MDGLVARTTKSAAFLLCVGLLLSVWTSDSVDNDVHRRDETSPSILSETARMRAPRLRMVRQWQQQPFGQAEPQLTKAPHEHGRAAMLLARTAVDGSTPRRTGAGQQELEKQLVNAFSRAITIADDAASGPRIQVRSSPRVSESVTSDAEFKRAGDRLAATEQGLGYDEAFQRGWKDRLAEAGNQEYQDFASHVNSNLLDAPQAAVTAAASSGPIPIHPSSPTRTLSSEAPPATASTAAASSSSSAGSLSIPSIDDLTKSLGRIAHSFREIGDPLAAKTTKTEPSSEPVGTNPFLQKFLDQKSAAASSINDHIKRQFGSEIHFNFAHTTGQASVQDSALLQARTSQLSQILKQWDLQQEHLNNGHWSITQSFTSSDKDADNDEGGARALRAQAALPAAFPRAEEQVPKGQDVDWGRIGTPSWQDDAFNNPWQQQEGGGRGGGSRGGGGGGGAAPVASAGKDLGERIMFPRQASWDPRSHIFRALPDGPACEEEWCQQGWITEEYTNAQNTSDPFAEDADWRQNTWQPGGYTATQPMAEQVVQAPVVSNNGTTGTLQYVLVPLSVDDANGGGFPRSEWMRVDDAFNASLVLNDTLRESTRAYDGTANLFNDSEVNLTWPDWQIQWLEAGVNPEYADMPYEEEMAE